MKAPHIAARPLPRRSFLRGAGVTLALPMLDCMTPLFAQAAAPPRRMLIIANNLGVLPKLFFPQAAGTDYELSPYLTALAEFRNDFTVFSGLSHPGVTGGHSADNCLLTAARGAFKSGFRNSISFDQFAAEKLGQVTRFPTLNLGVNIDKGNRSLSWTRDGVLLPAEDSAPKLYERMFVQGDQDAVAQQIHRLESRGSILDTLLDETKRFSRELGADDKARLDQYVTSVREVEERLQTARAWEMKPKPVATQPPPADIQDKKLFFEKFDLMLSMAQLALESDSTRIVTLMADAFVTPALKLNETARLPPRAITDSAIMARRRRKSGSSRRSTAGRWRCSTRRYRAWRARKRMASGCSTAPWCSTAATWATRTSTTTPTCRFCSPAGDSSMASISSSSATTMLRSAICS